MKSEQPKCIWTGEKTPEAISITLETLDRFGSPAEKTFHVLPEHEQDLRSFNNRFKTYGRAFLILIIILSLLLIALPLIFFATPGMNHLAVFSAGAIVSLIGVTTVIFPFSTPETIRWMGIYKAQKLTRILGFGTVILGIFITLL